jgi:hypothetical protein
MNRILHKNPTSGEATNILKRKSKEFFLNQYLMKAVEIGDPNEVQRLIQEGATLHKLSGMPLHKYNSEHDTLLHIAVKLGHIDVCKLLLMHKCNVNARTRRHRVALHYAMYPNVSTSIAELLLKDGADLEAKDDDNASAFMWACYLNNTDAVKLLITYTSDVYSADNFGLSPLEWSSYQGNLQTVKLLTQSIRYTQKQLAFAHAKAIENSQTKVAFFLEKLLKK